MKEDISSRFVLIDENKGNINLNIAIRLFMGGIMMCDKGQENSLMRQMISSVFIILKMDN